MEKRLGAGDGEGAARRKPAGGFCFISGTALLGAWWAYRRGFVSPLDLRVWLACFEAVARRCGVPRGRLPRFTVGELRALVGNDSDEEIRRSLGRLSKRGLVCWSQTAVQVGAPAGLCSEEERANLSEFMAPVPNHARRVPVPRRVIRLLARCGTRALLATTFGHLLRCSYYRGGKCRPTGTCKASWIADVFGVDVRNVKAARKALVDLGLLSFERVGQRFLNRYGPLVTVNLDWNPWQTVPRRLPPPAVIRRDDPPPLLREQELPRRIVNQNPAGAGGAGFHLPRATEGKPSLRHVVPTDLSDPARLAQLFEQACAAGHVRRTEADRLNFFAMAEHAQAAASQNAPGLFAANVRRQRWGVVTLADEDLARRKLQLIAGTCGARRRTTSRSELTAIQALLTDTLKGVVQGTRHEGRGIVAGTRTRNKPATDSRCEHPFRAEDMRIREIAP